MCIKNGESALQYTYDTRRSVRSYEAMGDLNKNPMNTSTSGTAIIARHSKNSELYQVGHARGSMAHGSSCVSLLDRSPANFLNLVQTASCNQNGVDVVAELVLGGLRVG